jgi:RNA polymerase sigma-70 factor (ECF subfamily)
MQADVALRLADDDCSTSDEELLERICERDVTALEALYDRHGGHAYSLAYRLLADRGMAEEVTQDAFMSVWRQAATYKPGAGRVRPWLLAIVHHRAIDRTRRIREKQPLAALDEAWMVQAGDDIFADVYRGVQREQIRAAMQQLPGEQRQAIELSYFGGRTFSEIAGMIGVPAGTVKSRVRLGLGKLKLLLDEELA